MFKRGVGLFFLTEGGPWHLLDIQLLTVDLSLEILGLEVEAIISYSTYTSCVLREKFLGHFQVSMKLSLPDLCTK